MIGDDTGRVPVETLSRSDRVSIPSLGIDGRVIDVLGKFFDAVGVIVLDGSIRCRVTPAAAGDGVDVEVWHRGTYRSALSGAACERRRERVVIGDRGTPVAPNVRQRLGVTVA